MNGAPGGSRMTEFGVGSRESESKGRCDVWCRGLGGGAVDWEDVFQALCEVDVCVGDGADYSGFESGGAAVGVGV